jgi:hypothetical protein
MIAFVSMVIRIEALDRFRRSRIEAALILIVLPAAFLVWPHWSVLIVQVFVGFVVAAQTAKLCAK